MSIVAINKPKLWALVDCATFYCSCERLFRPDLAGQPIVVLSNNDGCVVALTPEAKALGFRRGDVFFKNRSCLLEEGVAVFSSNYALYGDISRRVIMAMESVVPKVSPYSIDEAFVPFPESLAVQAMDVGRALVDRVGRWVGVPVRVGLGPTRTLAKLANHWAKTMGPVFQLEMGTDVLEQILGQTPVEDIWGVGRRLSVKLQRLNVTTAKALRDMEPARAGQIFGVLTEGTVCELRGYQYLKHDLAPAPRQTMVSSRSFGRRVTAFEDLAEALAHHCAVIGEKLRREGLKAAGLTVYIGTGHYDAQPFQTGATVTLSRPTNHTGELIKAAGLALERSFQSGHNYLKAGITVFELTEAESQRPTLFGPPPGEAKNNKLMEALDRINGRYGCDTVRYSAQGDLNPDWGLRREKLSDISTTDWSSLPVVTS
ncbi:MAG: Y-family DNA polymerase [Deltaproteobacteria bacterium]|jgi:DNA polymerase V|nr:Y-family DNA polymerase [Deltaproteobacteria bacterium]